QGPSEDRLCPGSEPEARSDGGHGDQREAVQDAFEVGHAPAADVAGADRCAEDDQGEREAREYAEKEDERAARDHEGLKALAHHSSPKKRRRMLSSAPSSGPPKRASGMRVGSAAMSGRARSRRRSASAPGSMKTSAYQFSVRWMTS